MIAKRSPRTSQPPATTPGFMERLSGARAAFAGTPAANNGKPRDRLPPGMITRDVAAHMLSPSGWTVLTGQLPAMAAALAYRTIFGLIPMIVIGLMVIGASAEEHEISSAVSRILHFAGLDQVAVDSTPQPAVGNTGGTPEGGEEGAITDNPVGKDPDKPVVSSQRLDEWIASLVKQVRTVPFRTIGFIGLAALIYAAMSMLIEIERTFNQIYRVPAGRAWWSRITRYWTLLTLGSIGLFATFYATDKFLSRIDQVESWSVSELIGLGDDKSDEVGTPERAVIGPAPTPTPGEDATSQPKNATANQPAGQPSGQSPGQSPGQLANQTAAQTATPAQPAVITDAKPAFFTFKGIMGFAVTVLISTGFLTVIYSVVPNARVRLTSAISGAFVAAILWEAAKWGFAYYVKSAGYTKLYGALALLPLFLLWIYVAWMIVLLGLFISYSLQTHGTRRVTVVSDGRTSIVDPASILLVIGAVAREFRVGRSVDAQDVSRMAGLEQPVVVSMLESMVARGLLHHVMAGDSQDRYSLARPPELIDAGECLTVATELVEEPGPRTLTSGVDSGLLAAVKPLQQARIEAAKGRNLADLLGLGPTPASKIATMPGAAGEQAKAPPPASVPPLVPPPVPEVVQGPVGPVAPTPGIEPQTT
jgi:uncharacterized BrkB/YihY/UPF0761 family membrane protein